MRDEGAIYGGKVQAFMFCALLFLVSLVLESQSTINSHVLISILFGITKLATR